MLIDCEHHFYLEERLIKGPSKSGKINERYWDDSGKMMGRQYEAASHVDRYLQFMDDSGIDMAVLSTSHISGLEQMKRWNDLCSKTVNKYPDRFAGFACIPPLEGKPALDEMERAIKGLGLKGVHIFTQADGKPLDSREYWPFYEKVSELGVPIDVHVTLRPVGFDALHAEYPLYYVMARELDMCATTLRVCLGGVLEDFPGLVLIMNHFGGGVSSMIERMDVYAGEVGPGRADFYFKKRLTSKPWREYFNKLYFNMGGREVGIEALKCALVNIRPDKILFGTDWPFNFDYRPEDVKRYVREIQQLPLAREDIEAMLGGNAARLFGIKVS